jgi:glycosyltransferase involved in cell wall biosynthesis
MIKLSVVIITKNESQNISRCLKSVEWADEITVLDTGSEDSTIDICKDAGCKIFSSEWLGYGRSKALVVTKASNDWILSIDADEELSPELAAAIQKLFVTEPEFCAYRIRRCSYYLGKMIRHCGWNRDFPVRLFNRQFGTFNDKMTHESVKIEGPKGTFKEPLYHYTYPTLDSHIDKMQCYSEFSATALYQKGVHRGVIFAVLSGWFKFIKMYVLQAGFLDGKIGFVLAKNSAFGVYLKYQKLWQKWR